MAAVTVESVRRVLQTSLTDEQVEAFIADADLWVTEELAGTATAARLELITRYLACALARLRDLGLKSATWKDVSESYQVDADVTDYLRRAASFDGTGKVRAHFLASGTGSTPSSFRVGTTFTDATGT